MSNRRTGQTTETSSPNNNRNNNNDHRLTKFEIASLALSIAAFGLSFYSVSTSLDSAQNIADYQIKQQMEQQLKFNKHATAMQLLFEIEFMNDTLQSFAQKYKYNMDLAPVGTDRITYTDKNIIFISNKANNSVIPYVMMFENGNLIARPTTYTFVDFNGSLSVYNSDLLNNPDKEAIYMKVQNPIIPGPIYNDHGMYYLYAKDLSNFNNTLAQELFTFYSYITMAEFDRQYLEKNMNNNSIDNDLNGPYFGSYMEMRFSVISASQMVPHLLEELKKEI